MLAVRALQQGAVRLVSTYVGLRLCFLALASLGLLACSDRPCSERGTPERFDEVADAFPEALHFCVKPTDRVDPPSAARLRWDADSANAALLLAIDHFEAKGWSRTSMYEGGSSRHLGAEFVHPEGYRLNFSEFMDAGTGIPLIAPGWVYGYVTIEREPCTAVKRTAGCAGETTVRCEDGWATEITDCAQEQKRCVSTLDVAACVSDACQVHHALQGNYHADACPPELR